MGFHIKNLSRLQPYNFFNVTEKQRKVTERTKNHYQPKNSREMSCVFNVDSSCLPLNHLLMPSAHTPRRIVYACTVSEAVHR